MTPLVERLEPLPGSRNVLVHEYVAVDYRQVLAAIDELGPVEEIVTIVAGMEAGASETGGGSATPGAPDEQEA